VETGRVSTSLINLQRKNIISKSNSNSRVSTSLINLQRKNIISKSNSTQFAKSTWYLRIFAKTIKNSLQQVGKTIWQFCELGKIPPSLGKYAKSSIIAWHHVYVNLPTSFANLLEAQICDFGKNPIMPSSFAKLK